MFERILLVTDGSAAGSAAVGFTDGLVTEFGGTVEVMDVTGPAIHRASQAAEAVAARAEDIGADAIVLGLGSGQGGRSGGRVRSRVMRRATVPVLVPPAP